MTPRKRKQPETKKPETKKKATKRRQGIARRGFGVAFRGLGSAAGLAGRNPALFGGSLAFAIVFSFVAANAVWYQPGAHPAPFLRTRLPFTHPQADSLGLVESPQGLTARTVTTFVIRRESDADTAVVVPADAPSASAKATTAEPAQTKTATVSGTRDATATDETASIIRAASQPEDAPDTALTARIQTELTRRRLYDGPADGRTGPKTSSAIAAFEKQAGLPQTGLATRALAAQLGLKPDTSKLAASKPATAGPATGLAAALPAQRPLEKVTADKGDLDPVAAAIRNAEINPDLVPKADIPASSELVMNIQKGLTNLAYTEVTIDGVAGEQTRAAIRHFENHYRLPETGEPSPRVLKKMKDIGAL